MKSYSDSEVNKILYNNIDVLLTISAEEDIYRTVKASGDIAKLINGEGSYKDLIELLLFHMSDKNTKITEEYMVFLPKIGEFKGKYSKKIHLEIDGVKHLVLMIVCPVEQNSGDYVMILCDLDKSEFDRNDSTKNKVKTIQETYLFSMYVDLNKDITGSINVSEISKEDMHYDVKYSEWRMMIVNMFLPEDQALFLAKSDPEYLKTHLKPDKSLSFDCQMKNLEGEYIWVKLIFGRTETTSDQDFRFVFMVENIHESSIALFNELKKFEILASSDALTGVFNHGRIETELNNAIDELKNNRTVSLMMFDIDYFKAINDSYGHAVGDEIIKAFINTANEVLKKHNIKVGRWGGDEFVCVCYDIDLPTLSEIAEKMRKAISNTAFDKAGTVTCSIGLAGLDGIDTASDAFERLDRALYKAKSDGRNCVRLGD